jgi:hypothetical protein
MQDSANEKDQAAAQAECKREPRLSSWALRDLRDGPIETAYMNTEGRDSGAYAPCTCKTCRLQEHLCLIDGLM